MNARRPATEPTVRVWLRRGDQLVVAMLTALGLAALGAYWWAHGGGQGALIDIDHAPPLEARFEVDVNSADWPELAQLPGVGETIARRIVEYRTAHGPFADHAELRRVKGIGPKTFAKIVPHLRAILRTPHSALRTADVRD